MAFSKMIPTEKMTGKGNQGWKWRRYECSLCSQEVPHNMKSPHMVKYHPDEWRENDDIDKFFKPVRDEK